jgi:hypothetical protein
MDSQAAKRAPRSLVIPACFDSPTALAKILAPPHLLVTSSSAAATLLPQQSMLLEPSGTSLAAAQKGQVRRRLTTRWPGLATPLTTPAKDTNRGPPWWITKLAASLGASSGMGTWRWHKSMHGCAGVHVKRFTPCEVHGTQLVHACTLHARMLRPVAWRLLYPRLLLQMHASALLGVSIYVCEPEGEARHGVLKPAGVQPPLHQRPKVLGQGACVQCLREVHPA